MPQRHHTDLRSRRQAVNADLIAMIQALPNHQSASTSDR